MSFQTRSEPLQARIPLSHVVFHNPAFSGHIQHFGTSVRLRAHGSIMDNLPKSGVGRASAQEQAQDATGGKPEFFHILSSVVEVAYTPHGAFPAMRSHGAKFGTANRRRGANMPHPRLPICSEKAGIRRHPCDDFPDLGWKNGKTHSRDEVNFFKSCLLWFPERRRPCTSR